MRVVKSTRHKMCADGSFMKEYVLDEETDEKFIEYLKGIGKVEMMKQIRQPFFAFDKEYFPSIKGMIGDNTVEVRYKKGFHDVTADYFHLLLYYYHSGRKPETEKFRRIEDSIWKKMKIRI